MWQKLERSAGDHLPLDRVEALLEGCGRDAEELVRERVALSQALATAATVDGWDAPQASRWTAWGTSGPGLRRSESWLPWRLQSELYLNRPGREYALSEEGIRLWGLCDGRPAAAIAADMERWLDARGRPGAGVPEYLDRLIALGLVRS